MRRSRALRSIPILIALAAVIAALARAQSEWAPLYLRRGAGLTAIVVLLVAGGVALARAALVDRPKAGIAWRLLLYCSVAFWVVYLAFAQPFWRPYFDLGLGLFAGLYGVLLLVVRRAAARPAADDRWSRRARVVDLLCFQACVVLIGGELALALAARVRPSPLLASRSQEPSERIAAARRDATGSRFGFPYDDRGFYDAPPSSRPFAATIGDSFSVGVVPHRLHFTTVAERSLEAPIYNVGFPSIGPHEYLTLLRDEVMPLDPAVIAILVFIGNDPLDAVVGAPANRRLRSWFSREEVRWIEAPRRLALLSRERRDQDGPARPIGAVSDADHRDGTPSDPTRVYPWLTDWRKEPPTFSAAAYLEHEASVAAWTCGPQPVDFEPTFAALDDMIEAAKDVPLVVVMIPDELQVEDWLWDEVTARVGRPLDRDHPQRVLRAFLDRRGVPVLDLLPALRAAPLEEDGRLHVYHARDTHWNAKGNQVAGAELARFLAPWLR